VTLAGCTLAGGADDGTERYASGDGVVTYVSTSRRPEAPSLTGTTLDGRPLDLATERAGGVAVVNTWGSWCAPCVAEQPGLERVAAATRSRGVRFVGINQRDNELAARRHVARYKVTYPSLFDPSARLLPRFTDFPARTVPTTYVIDRAGRIAAYAYGAIAEADLARLLDRVLAE
jgi:thiol-disulfide isomerase/thioredoxin